MPLTPEQIKAIADRAAGSILASKLKATDPSRTPREKELWDQGEEIARKLDNGVGYRGPWLPFGPDGEFVGHYFNDDAVTQTSLVCQNLEDCKADLVRVRKEYKAEPPVFRQEDVSQDWQLTKKEYYQKHPEAKSDAHLKIVQKALHDGRGIPTVVAKDYPEVFGKTSKESVEVPGVDRDIDPGVAGVIAALNQHGEITVNSCSGMRKDHHEEDEQQGYIIFKKELSQKVRDAAKKAGLEIEADAIRVPAGLDDVEIEKRWQMFLEDFTIQENVNPCPNLQPMAEWIKGETPGTCRPCTLTPVVQWYWEELKERGLTDIAAELEAEVDVLEEDNVEQVMAICKDLDEIKANAPEDLRKRLEEFDCAIQSFDPAEISDEEQSAG